MGARLSMVKTLLIIGAGVDQTPAYRLAQAMGIHIVGVDMNPQADAFVVADDALIVSTRDIAAVVAAARHYHTTQRPIDGVMTIGAEVSETVAAVAEAIDLPGVSPRVAFLTTNKVARAAVFRQHDVRFPHYWVGNRVEDFADVTYPAVIKPSDNSASRGVRLLGGHEELVAAFAEAKSLASDGQVMVEEYIPGHQLSVEGVVVTGRLYVTGIADRNYSRNADYYPLLIEDGGEMPSVVEEPILARVREEFARATSAIGIQTGPTKADIIISPQGEVYIIEVTSRLSGGGFCSRVVPMTTGVNIVTTTIQLALGLPVDLGTLQPSMNKGMCHRYFFHKPGVITRIEGLDTVGQMPGIVDFVINRPFAVGDYLEPINYANRLFYVIAIAETRDQAIGYAEAAIAAVTVEVQ